LKYNNDKSNGKKKLTDLIDNDLSVSISKLKNRKYVKPNRKKNAKPSIRNIFREINSDFRTFKHRKIKNNN
jgi:hypothetical protein